MSRKRRHAPWMVQRNGKFYVYWYDPDTRQTRRESLKTSSPAQARNAFDNFILKRAGSSSTVGHAPVVVFSNRTVAEVVDLYIRQHVEKRCLATERPRIAARHLATFFDGLPVHKVDIPASVAYADARRAGRVRTMVRSHPRLRAGDSTIRRELTTLGAASRWAIRHKLIAPEEMPTIEAPSDAPARKSFLTINELQRVLAAARPPLLDFILLCYFTGARRRSVEALTPGQIDFGTRKIHLMPLDAPALLVRSKKRRPTIPLMPDLEETLRRLVEGKAYSETLLPRRDYYTMFRTLMARLELSRKGYPHILRHTRATHLLQAGVTIWEVGVMLGDTVATIQKNYGHHDTDDLRETLIAKGPKLEW